MVCDDAWGFSMIHKLFQNGLQITEIYSRIISEWFVNHQYLPQNHFRMVHKSLRFTQNHFRMVHESMRFAPESFQDSLQITEISSFQNGLRIIETGPRIISEWFTNHWDLPQNHFRMVHESLRFIPESFQNGLLIFTENHKKTKVLPLRWSTAKWHTCLKIILFRLNLIGSANLNNFPIWSKP